MLDKHITLLACVAVSVMVACLSYTLSFHAMELLFNVAARHEAGYIGAMLFVIPGFPFITSGLDIAKMDMRSGLERLAHAIVIIGVATLVGWVTALVVHLQPENFMPLQLTVLQLMFYGSLPVFAGSTVSRSCSILRVKWLPLQAASEPLPIRFALNWLIYAGWRPASLHFRRLDRRTARIIRI